MELVEYVRVLRRRWRVIATIVGLAVTIALSLTLGSTPQYSSTARLFVSTPPGDGTQTYQGGLFAAQRVMSYADLAKGEKLSERVADTLRLSVDPAELSQRITTNVLPETVILEISTSDPNPRVAQRLTQTVAEQLTTLVKNLETPPGTRIPPVTATIVDPASFPETPVSPKPSQNLVLAVLVGLLLGVGAALLREVLDGSLKSEDDVVRTAGAPILGEVYYDRDAVNEPLLSSLDSRDPRSEAFRVLRTNLQFVDVDKPGKVIVVTSSVPQEGKTSTATNLAITNAQAGSKVLLVEADLRRPKISDYLSLKSKVGLTTVLTGRLELRDATQEYRPVPMLTVLASGLIPQNPSELLQSRAMADLLDEVRRTYDLVVVDAPALLPVTDAALLTAQADGAILVVRSGKTTREQLRRSMERLQAVGGHMFGVVLNMVPGRSVTYGGRYAYGQPGHPVTQNGQVSAAWTVEGTR